MKTQIVTIKYGVASNLVGNRYGIKINGVREAIDTTYATYQTALAKALAFAHGCYHDHNNDFTDTYFSYVFVHDDSE